MACNANSNVLPAPFGTLERHFIYDPDNCLAEVWRGAEPIARYCDDLDDHRVGREVVGWQTVVRDRGYEIRGGVVRKCYRLRREQVAMGERSTVYAVRVAPWAAFSCWPRVGAWWPPDVSALRGE